MAIAIYARQSLDKKDSISIETQIDLCKNEVDVNEIFEVYQDKGYSGSNINRPDFQRLLEDVKSGIITRVIIYRLDRMSRSILDFASLIEFFKKYGVDFQSTQEKFDTSTPIGNAMLSITMVFAQLERETIQQRIKDNYYARGKQGFYLGGPTPYGLIKIETTQNGKRTKTLTTNPETFPILKQMFELYAYKHLSLGEISKHLNSLKILSPKGVAWDSGKISRIMRNPIYVNSDILVYQYYKNRGCIMSNDPIEYATGNGLFLYGKRESNERKYTSVSNHNISLALHQGWISSDLFLIVQQKLDNNSQLDNSGKGKYSWLTGIVKCGICEYSLVVRTSNHGKYIYWYCSGRANGNCSNTISGMSIGQVEEIAKNSLFEIVQQNKDLVVQQRGEFTKELNHINAQLESLEQQAEKFIKILLESNEISAKYLNNKFSEIEEEKKNLDFKKNQILKESQGLLQPKQLLNIISDWINLNTEQKKEIALQFIDKVYVFNDRVKIIWKYNFLKRD